MMGPAIRAVFWVIVGGLAGALGSAVVGAIFGLAFWVTGIGFAYHLAGLADRGGDFSDWWWEPSAEQLRERSLGRESSGLSDREFRL